MVVAAGGLLMALGLAVLLGWVLQFEWVTRLSPRFVPMQIATAAGITLLGLALLGLGSGRRRLASAAGLAAMGLGLAALYAQIAGVPGASDPAVLNPLGQVPLGLLPLMATNTTIALALCSLSAVLIARRGRSALLPETLADLCALAALVLGAVSLMASISGVGLAPFWPYSADMAVHTALAFLVAGTSLFWHARHSATAESGPGPRSDLPPVLLVVIVSALSAVLWMNLERAEHRFADEITRANLASTYLAVERRLDQQLADTGRLASRLQANPAVSASDLVGWRDEAAVALTDERLRVSSTSEPFRSSLWTGALLSGSLFHRAAVEQALGADRPTASPAHALAGGGYGRYVYAPVRNAFGGARIVVALFDLAPTFGELLRAERTRGYAARVLHNGRTILDIGAGSTLPPHHVLRRSLPGLGEGWELAMWPLPGVLRQEYSSLPDTVLTLGVALGILLATSLRNRQQLADVNSILESRVQQRTRDLRAEIERREELARELAHAADHDALTGLPNRRLFQNELELAIARADRHHRQVAVMFLDLDRFKEINDSYGHQAGDTVLSVFAQRVKSVLRQGDLLARQGGDEFLLFAEGIASHEDAAEIATKIAGVMDEPVSFDGRTARAGTSVGIALYPVHGGKPDQLISHADAALYQAKTTARGGHAFYSEDVHAAARARSSLRAALQQALDREELSVVYQPRVKLADRAVVGAEALVRWQPADRPAIPPDDFIPVAEESGQIAQLGEQVMTRVLRDLQDWRRQGLELPQLSVNVSANQLAHSDSAGRLMRLLWDHRSLAPYIELELTERVLMDVQHDAGAALLNRIITMGYRIAVDDFGTGYSSLTYLRSFSIDTIKIDRSFVGNVETSVSDATIARAVIDLARNFGMLSVAEGVETREQARFLELRGCEEAQGFLFSPPVVAADFLALWRRGARL